MKRLLLLYTIIFAVNLVIVMAVVRLVGSGKIEHTGLQIFYSFSGIKQYQDGVDISVKNNATSDSEFGGEDMVINQNPDYSYFSAIQTFNQEYTVKTPPKIDDKLAIYSQTDLSKIQVDSDMIFTNAFREMPLHSSDYYYGKFTNALAGVKQLNTIPILKPGTSLGIIADGYINMKFSLGYVTPPGFVSGSGVCWSSSAMGAMFDDANTAFKNKYGVDLFIYRPGDRAPHGGFYTTYTNNHHGYTILANGYRKPAQDYRININPAIKQIDSIKDLKIKVVMLYSSKHPTAHAGESIAGYLISNVEF